MKTKIDKNLNITKKKNPKATRNLCHCIVSHCCHVSSLLFRRIVVPVWQRTMHGDTTTKERTKCKQRLRHKWRKKKKHQQTSSFSLVICVVLSYLLSLFFLGKAYTCDHYCHGISFPLQDISLFAIYSTLLRHNMQCFVNGTRDSLKKIKKKKRKKVVWMMMGTNAVAWQQSLMYSLFC